MNVIMDYRGHGRTAQLIDEAAQLQERVPGAIVYFIAVTQARAEYLSGRVFESLQHYTQGERGCVPDETLVMNANAFFGGPSLRGREGPSTKTFAFIDDVTDLTPDHWERLQVELMVCGVAISSIVVEAHR